MPLYECPKCKSTDLIVVECRVEGEMPLFEDGFEVEGSAYEEVVRCKNCLHQADIDKFMT